MKSSIAIVGMAGRFPGARNMRQFWHNLREGVESIRDLSDAELRAAGATAEDLANPDYVKRAAILDGVPLFDASFFGFSPRDASIMDPQHRHFLECAWEALEDAGHPPQRFSGAIGVFAGSGMNTYLIHNLLANRKLVESSGLFQLKQTGNDKDVLATRVSYQLDLRGPSINVQTACSTSLVAVHLACQSLLNCECDMALAGGVTIEIPHGLGYVHREGEILSRDGRCRSFDASSSGTVFASGLGIVVLRRLDDALADRDNIHAVILGSAINNDGARKVGYLAPSVEGQAEVIAEALDFAEAPANDIAYIETHGTGTRVGDPIEVRALTQAFRKHTQRVAYCGIGSLKSNVGHLDAAAGVAGLMKTALALKHAQIPATLNFEQINPHIELDGSPFYVNAKLADWPAQDKRRRAGVTSLGIGGTNAHAVLEEAPAHDLKRVRQPYHLLTVSAKTDTAADQAFSNLAAHLQANPDVPLADAAFTLQLGRQAFQHRRALVVEDTPEDLVALATLDHKRLVTGTADRTAPDVAFLFPGQGSQYVNMGRELYEHEPVFREALDACAHSLREPLQIDLIRALYPPKQETEAAAEKLNETWLTQPALFSVEYALARWWMSLGITPKAMAGHSIGEYVAACLAGVFTLEDALDLVTLRGRLIHDLPRGSMLAVPLAADKIQLSGTLSLAAINSRNMCVVSGPDEEIASLEELLKVQSIACRRLVTSHAFHSAMMEPMLGTFEERLRRTTLRPPSIPYLSNVTGTWIKPEEATDPAYWARHIRSTVQFSENLARLLETPGQILLESGPGNGLTSLARMQGGSGTRAYPTLPHPREASSALRRALTTLGHLWTHGVVVDWTQLYKPDSVQRVSLPTYPFERQRFWIEPDKTAHIATATEEEGLFFYRRRWKPAPLTATADAKPGAWIVFRDALGLADAIVATLHASKHDVILVEAGIRYGKESSNVYTIRPDVRADYDALLVDLAQRRINPTRVLHCWSIVSADVAPALEQTLSRSFYSPLYLAQALGAQDITHACIALVSNHLQQVVEEPIRMPARAVLSGPARVLPKELPGITCLAIDIDFDGESTESYASELIGELSSAVHSETVAYRQGKRWIETLEPCNLAEAPARKRLQSGGIYLITGGLGGLGLTVAEHLARTLKARLILVGRSPLPPESEWGAALHNPQTNEADRQRLGRLLAIRDLAGGLLVVQADVTDTEQVREALAQARQRFGTMDGVFHAAGVLEDGPLMLKTAEQAARVLAPKIQGTLAIDAALGDTPIQCFALFSSISSIRPPAGQVDYAAANAFLDAFALSRKEPLIAINWGAWRQTGMAARSVSPHPWLEERLLDTPNAVVYAGQFTQANRWVLSEHRFKNGIALIPGTGHMEMVASALTHGSQQGAVEFRDVFFLTPLMFDANETKEVRVQLERDSESSAGKGAFRFSVFASAGPARMGKWIEHCTGSIAPRSTRPATRMDRSAISARCKQSILNFDEGHRTRQEQQFDFGPRWRSLRRLDMGAGECLAEIVLEKRFAADVTLLRQHPALLDMATGAALYLTPEYSDSDDLFLPISYKRIVLYRALPAVLYSHVRARRDNHVRREIETFDLTIFDSEGEIIADIEGFSMRRIRDAAKAMEKGDALQSTDELSGGQPIEITVRPGIAPADGAHALSRILACATPGPVVVLDRPMEQAERAASIPTAAPAAQTAAAPPALQTGSINIESTLILWWQELLGTEQIGVDDDFFELGGHSLVGVRLIVKIKKHYRLDLELAVLFEARTVRQLAALIRTLSRPVETEQKTWATLVPIQPKGARIPLFCVHAVGGDVLFYEQLARALGPDQPFYAFRSALISQESRRTITLEELAAVYVKEMRAFYPQGPYLIGGASYGGIVAFEIARQLHAQGVAPALLLMFDTSVPGSEERVPATHRASTFWQNLSKQGVPYLARKAKVKLDYWGENLWRRTRALACSCYRLAGLRLPVGLRYFEMDYAHRIAVADYTFPAYAGRITLMRASDRGPEVLGKKEHRDLGWASLASGGLEIIDVPTRHMYMLFDPYVSTFAETLHSILPS